MAQGTVSGSTGEGYGFITADGGQDVFVHHTSINQQGFRAWRRGSVSLRHRQGPKGNAGIERNGGLRPNLPRGGHHPPPLYQTISYTACYRRFARGRAACAPCQVTCAACSQEDCMANRSTNTFKKREREGRSGAGGLQRRRSVSSARTSRRPRTRCSRGLTPISRE